MGNTLADTLNEYASIAQSQTQLQPRPAAAGANPPTPTPQPPIASPIPGTPSAGPPKPVKQPGVLQALGGLFTSGLPGQSQQKSQQDLDTLKGIGAGILRSGGQLVGGMLDTDADAGKFIGDNIVAPMVRAAGASPQTAAQVGSTVGKLNPGYGAKVLSRMGGHGGASLSDVLSNRQGLGQVGNTAVNQVAAEGVAATAPMLGAEGMANSAIRAGIGAAVAFNPDPNHPLLSRLENAGVGAATDLGLGVAGKVVGGLLKKATKITEATPAEAAADSLNRTFATTRTTDARYAAVDPAAEPEEQAVVQPERHTDQKPLDDEPKVQDGAAQDVPQPAHPLATDANAVLDKAGAAERLPTDGTHEVSPDGRLVVDPATKATLDEQSMGRAFVGADQPAEPKIFLKETDPQGGSRVVGAIGQDDLNGFLKDADHFRKNPDEVYQNSSHPTGQWKLPILGSIDDVGSFARAMSDRIEGVPERTNAADLAAATAKVTGMDPGDISRLVGEASSDASKVREATLTVRLLHQKAMQELGSLGDHDFSSLDPNSPIVQDAISKVHNAMVIHTHANVLKSEAGATLQLHGVDLNTDPAAHGLNLKGGDEIPPDPIPDFPSYKDAFGKTPDEQLPSKDPMKGPGLPRTPKELDNWVKAFNAAKSMDDPLVLNRFLMDQPVSLDKWKYLRNSYVNAFTASIVSAPRTLVRDAWGPGIVSGFNTVGRSLGNGLNAVNPLLSDAERSAAWAASWSAPRAYARTMLDSLDALKQAGATVGRQFQNNSADSFLNPIGSNLGQSHSLLGGHNPIDVNVQGVPSSIIHLATQTDPGITGATPYYLGNLINKWPQVIQALHGGVNDFAQRLSYLGEVRASAYQEAAGKGLQGDDFNNYVRDRLSSSVDPVSGAASDASALDSAQRTTFTRRPVPGQDPMALQKAMQWRSEIVQAMPEARFIMPIFTVPANAMGETLRRIPILNLIGQETRNELSGAAGVVAQGDAYGRMLTGGSALLAGYGLARMGALTGAGPEEANARRVWMQTHQPYSIKVGGKFYSYAKSDILGPMLGIIAGSYDKSVYTPGDEGSGSHAWGAAMGLAGYFKDQASLKGLSDMMNIGGNPQASEGIVNRFLGGVASGYIPNFVQQLARETTDPLERVKRNPWDYIKDRLPGQSETLDPSRNTLGEPVHKPTSPGLNSFPVNIANANTYAKDPVMDEMGRLQQSAGYAPGVLPTSAGPNTHTDLRDIKAEDGYSVYEHEMRQLPEVKNDQGQTLRAALQDTINSPEYQQAMDGKGKSLDAQGDESDLTRGGMLQKNFDDFHKLARQAAAQQSPVVARILATASAKSHDPVNLGKYPVKELATDAGSKLMSSLGIDINQFENTVKGNP